jgi:hypothetical protein
MTKSDIARALAALRKHKRGHGPERADPHYQGLSGGASDVAEALRREAEKNGM